MQFILTKARPTKYKRRWKDAKGRWQYEYDEPKKPTKQLGLFAPPRQESDAGRLHAAYLVAKAALKAGSSKTLVDHLRALTPEQRVTVGKMAANIEPNPKMAIEDALAQIKGLEAPAAAIPTKEDAEYAARVAAYEEKQEAKRERYEARANAAARESERRFDAADLREERSGIPMGQPVLVGHHSEKRHRAALDRADRNIRAGLDAQKKAEHYERKAAGVGSAGISSDDPAAVQKLKAQILEAEQTRAEAKAVNRAYKKHGGDWAKVQAETGASDKVIANGKATLRVTPYEKKPFPGYMLTNLGANIRRMQKRVDTLLESAATPVAKPVEGEGYRIVEDKDDNRIRMFFDEKPSPEARKKLKGAGFRWSPSIGAWQRHLNNAGRYAVERMRKELFPEGGPLQSAATAGPSPQVATELSRREGATQQDLQAALTAGDYSVAKLEKIREHVAELYHSKGAQRLVQAVDAVLKERSMGKSETTFVIPLRKAQGLPETPHVIDLEKAGPFIGPKGGKWADARHTIPWKEAGVKPARASQYDVDRAKRIVAIKTAQGVWDSKFKGKPTEGKGKTLGVFGKEVPPRPVTGGWGTRIKDFIREHAASEVKRAIANSPEVKEAEARLAEAEKRAPAAKEESAPKASRKEVENDLRADGMSSDDIDDFKALFKPGVTAGEIRSFRSLIRDSDLRDDFDALFKSELEKGARVAGPFIGPRGGKWADAKHKTPWKERKAGRNWVNHKPGLPMQTTHKYATKVGIDKDGDPIHVYQGQRKDLHDKIVMSFIKGRRPSKRKVAVVMMGGAASGKTSLLKKVLGAKFSNFVNVNPDDVKEKLPEYNAALNFKQGGRAVSAKDAAWMAHEESSDVAQEVYNRALDAGLDMIVDGTGKNGEKHRKKIEALKAEGYEVQMIMPHIDKADALQRIAIRADKTGRFVPDSVAEEQYSKIPGNFEPSARLADSFALYDNSGPAGSPARVVWDGPPDKVHDQAFVQHFKTKGASEPFRKADPSGIRWDKLDADNFIPRKGKRLRYA